MSHLDEGTLHALLDGELELAEVKEIQTHLGTCAACGSRLQDVKQFLAEADRLVGALEVPAGSRPPHADPAGLPEPPAREAPRRDPIPARAFREQENWEEPPVLLLPDPLEGLARRKRWMRGLRLAAMIALVVLGGRALTNMLRPSRPELQFPERDLATPPRPTPPAVVSPEERVKREPPLVAKQSRPAPGGAPRGGRAAPAVAPVPSAPEPEQTTLATQARRDSATDEIDTVLAGATDSTPSDSTPLGEVVAAAPESVTPAPTQRARDTDLETRRAAAAALAELDRERIRSRANAATASLPPPRTETLQVAEAPPPPRTLEQRAQVYLRIGLDEAVKQLGRPVHVIEAMTPEFIGLTQGRNVSGTDAARPVVRVVYLDPRGRMILLDQQRLRTGQAPGGAAGSLRWTRGDVMLYLHGDAPSDLLRSLQKRVR
jgi:putative zinc finger protein